MALSHPYTAVHLAQVFLNVDKLHGLPASILSERDKVFTILEGAPHNGGHWAPIWISVQPTIPKPLVKQRGSVGVFSDLFKVVNLK